MIRSFLHNKFCFLFVLLLSCVGMISMRSFKNVADRNGILKISFVNTANGKILFLRDSIYINPFGEQYSVSKLKYYISNCFIPGSDQQPENDPYHLMNAADSNNSFELSLKPGDYKNIQFLLGVDSARNCSGAQTGALDPMNDMFWTWNSGYVMFKLEGTSSSSKADLQRIEHHIGGFKGANNVATKINLDLRGTQSLLIKENQTTELVIKMDLDHYWKAGSEIKISEIPVCMTPGPLSKKIAANFNALFSVMSIK